MDIGLFAPTQNNGWVMSTTSPRFDPDFFFQKQLAQKADYYDYDFLLMPFQFHGFGGETGFWEYTVEPVIMATAIAAVTRRIRIFPSIPILNIPPAFMAKQASAMADVSDGRMGLNIVTGWEKEQYSTMGTWPGDEHFKNRYDRATEYVNVMRELWATGRSSFDGEFYHLDNCRLGPTPRHKIEIVMAGQSDRGMRCCAEVGDYQFLIGDSEIGVLRDKVASAREQAAAVGREDVALLPLYRVVQKATTQEALETIEDWRANQDVEAVANMMGVEKPADGWGSYKDSTAAGTFAFGENGFLQSIPTIVGDADAVAEQINAIGAIDGVEGIMIAFTEFRGDLDSFALEVMPKLA
jgi:pyrimidine oxygenase